MAKVVTLIAARGLLITLLGGALSCASVRVAPRLQQLRSVAIIGLTGHLDLQSNRSRTGRGQVRTTINATNSLFALASGALAKRRAKLGAGCYGQLAEALEARGWRVLNREALVQNKTYQAQRGEPENLLTGYGTFGLQDVLRFDDAESLKPEALEALLDALKVDALVAVELDFKIGAVSGRAKGGPSDLKRHPQASVKLRVFDRAGALWTDDGAQGAVTRVSISNAAPQENRALLAASLSAMETLMRRLSEEASKLSPAPR